MGGEYLSVKTGEIQNQFSSTWVWWMLSGQEHTQCCSIWQVFSVKKVCRCFCLWCESFIFIYTETFSIYSLIMCNLRFSNAFKSNLHGFFKLKTNMRSLVIATILAMDFFVDIFFQRILNFSNALASNVHDQNRDFFSPNFHSKHRIASYTTTKNLWYNIELKWKIYLLAMRFVLFSGEFESMFQPAARQRYD